MQSGVELVGGPMDGDHYRTAIEELYFTSSEEGFVHYYQKLDNQFEWQGLVPMRSNIKFVLRLDPGQQGKGK